MSYQSILSFKSLPLFKHQSIQDLIDKTIEMKLGALGARGELLINTFPHTGRSADDKYVVKTKTTENSIWWENNIHSMTPETFLKLEEKVFNHFKNKKEIFSTRRNIGSENHIALGIDVYSTFPYSIMFSEYMFKSPSKNVFDEYLILHAPDLEIDPKEFGLRSKVVISTCFERKITIIIGTKYSGEIKKSMFSILNFLLPEKKVLPMHSGANLTPRNESFIFFGLSGTGKTTLSTDIETKLIGDDEHGLAPEGVFNFEGGCYAKTFKLGADTEPDIYKASTRKGSFLENVYFDNTKNDIDFFNGTETENGRSSYPLDFIPNRVPSAAGPVPKDIFFLSADAFGVLPPLARLTSDLAKKYFILGYTAKLAGTEIGIKTPKATFSPCFGAPFMLRHPAVYAALLEEYVNKYNIRVWLVNTGWHGGAFGEGERFPLKITRDLIRAVQNHELPDDLSSPSYQYDEIFEFYTPKKVRDINPKILSPINDWKSSDLYISKARELKTSFDDQLKKFL